MNRKQSVLITGASSGIGKACVKHLAQLGFKVYATVRNHTDHIALTQEGDDFICPVVMDVTDQSSIAAVYQTIAEDTEYPLYALINNAGVGISGVVEATPVEAFRQVMEVNVVGMHAVTQAFLPLIRQSKGRIVNMGSIAGLFAAPGSSAYSASKFAVRAFTDALRIEMLPYGVKVGLIVPGAIETEIWNKSKVYKKELRKNTSKELQVVYEMFIKAGDKMVDQVQPVPAHAVAVKVEKALLARKPKCYYMVGKETREALFFLKFPRQLLDRLIVRRLQAMTRE